MTDAIVLPRRLVQKMFAHAQLTPGAEVCGLLSSQDGRPIGHYPIPNASEEPARLFAMDSAAQISAMKKLRTRGETLFAIYHSHPGAPAEPSLRDQAELAYPEAAYLIISLNTKGVLELRAWRQRGETLQEVPLKILED